MNATLFLDLDDVLCLNTPYGGVHVVDIFRGHCTEPGVVFQALFAQDCVTTLRRIHEVLDGQIRYVISSTWRETFSRGQMLEIFRRSGIGFVAESLHDVAWCTPIDSRAERADEVIQWLDDHHRGEPFAVLDDHYSGRSLKNAAGEQGERLAGHVVLCQEGHGLTAVEANVVTALLRAR